MTPKVTFRDIIATPFVLLAGALYWFGIRLGGVFTFVTVYNVLNETVVKSQWLIWSIEHDAWWKPSHNGYTNDLGEAGVYTYAEACAIVKGANINTSSVPNEAMIYFDPNGFTIKENVRKTGV